MKRKDKSIHNNTHHSTSRGWEKKMKKLASKRARREGKVAA